MSDIPPDSVVIDDDAFSLPPDNEDSLVCSECGRDDFKNARGLSRHRSIAHNIKSAKADQAPRSVSGGGRTPKLDKELTEMVTYIGMMVMIFNQFDGMVVMQNAESTASAWAQLARTDKNVANVLNKLITGTAYSGVILATVKMAVPILANHGVVPPEFGSIFNPMAPPSSPEATAPYAQET